MKTWFFCNIWLLHTKNVKTWLQERSIQVLDWPANSPDLNIAEEVWNIMKRRKRSSRPASLVELKGLIANTWFSIQVQELESLSAAMPKRIAAVIREQNVTFYKSQNTVGNLQYEFNSFLDRAHIAIYSYYKAITVWIGL